MEYMRLVEARSHKVVKANDLIQKTRFNLSSQEQKIILYIISKIKPEDTDFKEMDLSVAEFCEVCGIDHKNGKNYRDIKAAIKDISDKSIWIELDEDTETLIRWIEKSYIYKNSGIIKIRLDNDMKPYLLQLRERFTQYELLYILAMKSQYSIRLYELLKSYEWQYEKKFGVDELKRLLNAEVYKLFGDFKRRVLDISMREISKFTDLKVSYKTQKKGQKVTSLVFTIKLKIEHKERALAWKKIQEEIGPKQDSLFDRLGYTE